MEKSFIFFKEQHREEFIRIFRFGIIGVLNTIVFFVLFFILFNVMKLHYLSATSIAYILATINSFVFNRSWTFESYGDTNRKFVKFFIVNILSIIVNSLSMFVLVDLIHLHPWLSQFITICFTMCVNYLGNRFWTFYE
ncbi:MAG TPA: GtrA family protein [Spirochaetota bacterium]|jgi:putative flippase GtrA|nr:GtrA family protein [Spirochaetota bacterium]HOV08860.1 GtrA family protein [Spirochaetota bacterium]